MSKVVKDLNFEQIVTIYNAICNCRDSVYGIIGEYGLTSDDIIKISNAFANFINTIHGISDEADYNDVMNLCHNFSQHVPQERKEYFHYQLNEMLDEFYK